MKLINQTKLDESIKSEDTRGLVGKAIDALTDADNLLDKIFDEIESDEDASDEDFDTASGLRADASEAVATALEALKKLKDL